MRGMALRKALVWAGLAVFAAAMVPDSAFAFADDKAKKTLYKDALQVFQARCLSCHNGDKQKGGLVLDNFLGAMQGGGSGKVIEPGDASASTLYLVVNHEEEPKMPPNSPKIPDAEIAIIKKWIDDGAAETEAGAVAMPKKPKFEFKLDPSQVGKPNGPPAMPEKVSTEPVVVSNRANAILAMAHSPWAPLAAVAGHKQVLLYRTDSTQRLLAVFPFPEGTIHSLKFSRNGELLIAGGGRGGQSGLAVVYNVKNGQRVFEIGKEYDSVLAADISPDQSLVALGGPSKTIRVYNTSDGSLAYELKKHTEWITAIEFSPDGVLLATSDRNQGLLVWEALTGREFFDLRGHGATVTDLGWRPDSNVLASSSEDTTIRLWEMTNGTQIKSWGAHGGGAKSVRFALDGRLVTSGRDGVVRLWDQNGGKQRDFESLGDLALQAVISHDGQFVIGGGFTGEVRIWRTADGVRLNNLLANPAPLAARMAQVQTEAKAARDAADALGKEAAALKRSADAVGANLAKANAAFADVQKLAAQRQAELANAQKAVQEKTAAETNAANQVKALLDALTKVQGEKAAHEKAIADATAGEKPAADALAAAKTALDQAITAKATLDKQLTDLANQLKATNDMAQASALSSQLMLLTLQTVEKTTAIAGAGRNQAEALGKIQALATAKSSAAEALKAIPARIKAADDAYKAAQATVAQATVVKNQAAQTANAAAQAQQTAMAGVAPAKAQVDQLTAAKTAADKAVNDKAPAVQAANAKADALKADFEAFAAEKKASDAAKSAMATPIPKAG